MRELLDIIWKAGGYRFWHRRTTKDSGLIYEYYCSQDSSRDVGSTGKGKRDARRMERFQCKSKLRLRPCLEDRTLTITLYHLHHAPYVDIQLSPAVLEFVQEHISTSTPSEIYRSLLASNIPGAGDATQHQIYYQWQQANSSIWRRDSDQFVSARRLLADSPDKYQYATYISGNMRGLAFYVRDPIAVLTSEAKEVAMDATYGTNSAGIDLFAVLAEVDGTGVPLAYCFAETLASEDGKKQKDSGAITCLLTQFLRPLKTSGFRPTFFGSDKDFSEIGAIKQIWPDTTIQLCYWHAKCAIRDKLKDSKKTNTQNQYLPADPKSSL